MGRKHGRTIEGYEKDQKALELRKEGHTYESISEQLGYSTPSASYKAVMRRLRDVDRPAVSMLRELEVQRLDAMLYAVWEYVIILKPLQPEALRSRDETPLGPKYGYLGGGHGD